jgi:superoxide dismutase, Fe-Mn family
MMTRRNLIGSLLAGTGGLILGREITGEGLAFAADPAGSAAEPGPFQGKHAPKALPFEYGAIKGLSEKMMKSHWENNYSGAVKALNAVETKLLASVRDKDFSPNLYGALKREQLTRAGSLILHERFFYNLGGERKPAAEIKTAIDQAFGSVDIWDAEFRKTALSLSGGSGWVVLAYNLHLGGLTNYWSWDHMHNLAAGYPLLVLDMYEHAYQMDYGAQAAKYLDVVMQNINWEEVNRRYLAIKKAEKVLL